jgi:hypothetical protein
MTSLFLIVWASLPNPHQSITQPISYAETKPPIDMQGSTSSMMVIRQVVLDWPRSMRIGDADEITLILEPVESGASTQNPSLVSTDIYSIYNIMAEARLEVAGITTNPANPIRESMPVGQTVKYRWEVNTTQVGRYTGKVWLYLRLLPLDGSTPNQVPIFIRDVAIQAYSLIGMTETAAYLVGGVGIALVIATVYSDMMELIKRLKSKKTAKYTVDTNEIES